MKHYHSTSSFGLFRLIAVAALVISYSGNSAADASASDGNGADSTTSQQVHAGDGFVLDGYNAIKFGMNVIELENMGYKCPKYSKTICRLDDGMTNTETLLGEEANLMVWIDGNEVRRIDVSVDVKPKDMLHHFIESLGEPEMYRYISLTNNLMEAYYWVSLDGSSESHTRDYGKLTSKTGKQADKESSTMKYKNNQSTIKSNKKKKKI